VATHESIAGSRELHVEKSAIQDSVSAASESLEERRRGEVANTAEGGNERRLLAEVCTCA
jgi:hypothetical protein